MSDSTVGWESDHSHSSSFLTFSWRNDLALTEQFPCTPGFPFTDWCQGSHMIELEENKIWGWMFYSDPCPSGPSTRTSHRSLVPTLPPAFPVPLLQAEISSKHKSDHVALLLKISTILPATSAAPSHIASCLSMLIQQATHCCRRVFVRTVLLPLFHKLLFITQP